MSGQNIVYHSTKGESFKDVKRFEEPIPKIESNELLIKVKAVSLNYRDYVG